MVKVHKKIANDNSSQPPVAHALPLPAASSFAANRAHHADIGGATPGSMGLATDVYGEGLRIPPIRPARKWSTRRRYDAIDLGECARAT
jgi:hypothetical protein